ncbi:MAG TPA: FlgD immunoglobulin-like domain containing protein, partial [Candidatus Udaeobacter sp.]|nr:FlgD immunoglobulin-like domain containing protein [Candidatus Udaeobacter sp.]
DPQLVVRCELEWAPARGAAVTGEFEPLAVVPARPELAGGWWTARDQPAPGRAYAYRVQVLHRDGGREPLGPVLVAVPPATAARLAVWPNPTGGPATIELDLAGGGSPATLSVYDPAGRRVASLWQGALAPGSHVLGWDGRDRDGRLVPNGTYFVRFEANGVRSAARLTIVR